MNAVAKASEQGALSGGRPRIGAKIASSFKRGGKPMRICCPTIAAYGRLRQEYPLDAKRIEGRSDVENMRPSSTAVALKDQER